MESCVWQQEGEGEAEGEEEEAEGEEEGTADDAIRTIPALFSHSSALPRRMGCCEVFCLVVVCFY